MNISSEVQSLEEINTAGSQQCERTIAHEIGIPTHATTEQYRSTDLRYTVKWE